MKFTVKYEQEEDGRWLPEVLEMPGVLAYGKDPDEAVAHAQALALRVIADRLENGESIGTGLRSVFLFPDHHKNLKD